MSKYLTDFLLEIKEDADESHLTDECDYYLFDWSEPESKKEMLDIVRELNLDDSDIAIIESSVGAILKEESKDIKDSTVYDSIEMLDDAWNDILETTENDESENEDS